MTEEEYKQHLAIYEAAIKYLEKVGSFYFDEDCKSELTDAYEAGYRQALADVKNEPVAGSSRRDSENIL